MTALQTPGIRVLSPEVAGRIAAGEVVERPASVVKELVENAIDAGAQRVEIEVTAGGAESISVADDGWGIRADELPLAFARHATSKLASDDELGSIHTLGFRGEALPSIAAVAHVTCLSRSAADPEGRRIAVSFGTPEIAEVAVRAAGTTVLVQDLFARVPARRKYLRGRAAETAAATQTVQHLALSRPEIKFELRVDGRVTFTSGGDGDLTPVAMAVLNLERPDQLVPIDVVDELGASRVWGVLGGPHTDRATRSGMSFFVNGRWIQSRWLNFAVEEACRTWTPTGRFPIAVVHLEIPATELDVNVHPRKSEVRLLRERAVFALVQRGIRAALLAGQGSEVARWGQADEDLHRPDALRVLGQVTDTYIIAEGHDGLYLVDQHAAHERVLLEALRRDGEAQAYQWLIEPMVLPLSGEVIGEAEAAVAALSEAGFACELFGDESVLVRAVPAALVDRQPLQVLSDSLDQIAALPGARDWRSSLAVALSCRAAIKAGQRLETTEMQALLEQLGEAEICGACAHGRPTAILMRHEDLARQFGRR